MGLCLYCGAVVVALVAHNCTHIVVALIGGVVTTLWWHCGRDCGGNRSIIVVALFGCVVAPL